MDTQLGTGPVSAEELNTLHDEALRRAHALRREAIDDFWRGADAAYGATLSCAYRSAQRLAHRMARHARGRSEPTDAFPIHPDGV